MTFSGVVVYPTSANPPTWGHGDILYRAGQIFRKIYWVASVNPQKASPFTTEDRRQMMQAYVDHYGLKNVEVDSWHGATVRYAQRKGAQFLLRGLRNSTDFQMELDLAAGNRGLDQNIETICLFSRANFASLSSSLIRELAQLGEDITPYVCPAVEKKVLQTLGKKSLT